MTNLTKSGRFPVTAVKIISIYFQSKREAELDAKVLHIATKTPFVFLGGKGLTRVVPSQPCLGAF